MTTPRDNPAPLTEDQLLDWVEGRLSPADEARLAAASGRSGLAERVAQMQANRRALRSLAEVAAPRDLMDRVGAALERDALLGLATGDEVENHPPISLVIPERRWRLNRFAPKLALAAGVILMVTGVFYFGSSVFNSWPSSYRQAPGPIALNQGAESGPAAATAADTALAAEIAPLNESAPTEMLLAEAPAAKARPGPVTDLAHALQLAAEGRLAIRVYSPSRFAIRAGLESMETIAAPGPGKTWTMTRDVPEAVAAAVMPVNATYTIGRMPDIAMASARSEKLPREALSVIGPGGAMTFPMSITIDRLSRVRGAYLIDAPDSERALTAIRNAFQSRIGGEIVFEELAEPLDLPAAVDPAHLLWWTNAPAEWTRRVQIPVVVEER